MRSCAASASSARRWKKSGIACDPRLVRYDDFTHCLVHRHALELLASPTARWRSSRKATVRGWASIGRPRRSDCAFPDDVSLVGFGDLPFVDWVHPRLTTVRTPLADMTARATCTVPLLLSGQQPETAQAEVTIELVVRDSSGPPAGDGASRRTQSGGEGRLSRGRARAPGARSGRRAGEGAVTWRSSAAQPAMVGWEFESLFHQCVGETGGSEARCRPGTGLKWRRRRRG
ncbi:substrate-binding domain-containing protein [Streptomyces sp. B21-101]|uniref:substrate-binding domain-containing protein n=1 Tax=Streptomyces TaxID=1883 RepID=UPI002FF36E56